MRVARVQVYGFHELPAKAQDRAIREFSEINVMDGWYEPTIEEWEARLCHMGFIGTSIRFSGFSSQGDGASFTAEDVAIEKIVTNLMYCTDTAPEVLLAFLELAKVVSVSVPAISSRYSHEYTCHLHMDGDVPPHLEETLKQFEEVVEDLRIITCRRIYDDLCTDYEYLTSAESIGHALEASEYEFTVDGAIFNIPEV